MANNVYIGNRYVPIFADPVEWNNLREYEPLTIVTYQGTAYTSRKTVPVGTALSNTEYWVVTGNYNAQVEQYRQEVIQLEQDIVRLDPLEKFRGKTICIIGDSISDYDVLAHNWVYFLTQKLSSYNCTVINASDAGRSFASLKTDMVNGLVTIPNADYYVLFVGLNYGDDWAWTNPNGTFPLVPAITYVNNAIKTANPNAKYFFISPMKCFVNNVATKKNPLAIMRTFLEQTFAEYGYTVISGFNMGEMSAVSYQSYTIDGIHPNETYSKIIYENILDGLISERSNITTPAVVRRSYPNTPTNNSAIRVWYEQDLSIAFDLQIFNYEPTLNQWVDLLDAPTMLDNGGVTMFPSFYLHSQGGTQYRINSGKLQGYFFALPSANNFYEHIVFRYDKSVNC